MAIRGIRSGNKRGGEAMAALTQKITPSAAKEIEIALMGLDVWILLTLPEFT
jgi:hypothetical protein